MNFGGDHPAHGHGEISPRCVPEGASDKKNTSSWQYIAAMYSDSATFGKICVLCIQKAPQSAVGEYAARTSCHQGAFSPPEALKSCTAHKSCHPLMDLARRILGNVTARTKCFIDRTRPLHMVENQLKGKVGGFLTMAGLDNCGAEATNHVLENFFTTHEMLVVHPRPAGPVIGSGITGSLMAGMKDGKPRWRRSVEADPIAVPMAKQLGRDMADLIARLHA